MRKYILPREGWTSYFCHLILLLLIIFHIVPSRYCSNCILLKLVPVARHFVFEGVGVVIDGDGGVVVSTTAGVGFNAGDADCTSFAGVGITYDAACTGFAGVEITYVLYWLCWCWYYL